MNPNPLPRWDRGESLTAAKLNNTVDAANAQRGMRGGPGIKINTAAGVLSVSLDPEAARRAMDLGFWAKITGVNGATGEAHQWTEQRVGSSLVFEDVTNGRNSTQGNVYAYEINGRQNVPNDTLVWLIAGAAEDGTAVYLFDLAAGLHASPTTLSGSGSSANATTWDVNSQAGTGANLKVLTHAYAGSASANQSPTIFSRTVGADSNGNIVDISGESAHITGSVVTVLTASSFADNTITFSRKKIGVFDDADTTDETEDISVLATDEKAAVSLGGAAGYLYYDLTTHPNGKIETAGNLTSAIVNDRLVLTGTDPANEEVTVIVGWRYDATTHKFQVKTRTVTVLEDQYSESGWTDADTAFSTGNQPVTMTQVVRDVNYSTSTHVLSEDVTANVYVLDKGSDTNTQNIDSAESC